MSIAHSRFFVLGSSLLLSFIAALPALAQPPAAIKADARIDRSRIALSESLTLSFRVEGPKGFEVEPVKSPSPSPLWEVKLLTGPEMTPLPAGRTRWEQSFRLEPLQSGQAPLPLAPLRYRLAGGPWQELPWKELTIEVTTEVLKPELAELRGNSQIEELPPAPTWPTWPLVAAAILLAGSLLGLVAWRRSRKREQPAPALTPNQWALKELERIDGQSLPQAGEVERFHRLLSDVLRRYVELRLGLPATQQTTMEFLAAARQSPNLSSESQELLRQFLERCDLAKFARAEFGIEDCQTAARLARAFIQPMTP